MARAHDPQLLKGILSLLLLQLLAEQESYGYEVVQRLHATGLVDVAEGTVYPALSRLERERRLSARLVASQCGACAQVLPPDGRRLRGAARRRRQLAVARRDRRRPAQPLNLRTQPTRGSVTCLTPCTWFDRARVERVVWVARPAALRPAARLAASRSGARSARTCSAPRAMSAPAPRSSNSARTAELASEYLTGEYGERAAALVDRRRCVLRGHPAPTDLPPRRGARWDSATASPPQTRTPPGPSHGTASRSCRPG